MGNCFNFDRPIVSKSHINHQIDSRENHNHLNSTTLTKLNPSLLLPILIEQPFLSPTNSPISTPNRPKSNLTVRTPSSSGVSSVSSSAISPKTPHENTISNRFQYIAIFDYDARTKDDLTIRKNDPLEIINRKSSAWWKAKNENGQEGWIPSNYVARRDSLESEP